MGKMREDIMAKQEDIVSYRCTQEDQKERLRRNLCSELRCSEKLDDAIDTIIRILQLEFGDDYDG